MKQEDKIATPEQSNKLLELGFKMKTEKQWFDLGGKWKLVHAHNPRNIKLNKLMPAPDVAELGEVLKGYDVMNQQYDDKDCNIKDVYWLWNKDDFLYEFFNVGTEAQARAASLIWLIEHKHIKV